MSYVYKEYKTVSMCFEVQSKDKINESCEMNN